MRLKLEKQYRYLHIDITDSNNPTIKFDSLKTLSNIFIFDKTVGLYDMFGVILENNNVNTKNLIIDNVSDPQILWMDYKENYIDTDKSEFVPPDDVEEDEEDLDVPRFLNFGNMMNQGEELVITPWGKFLESDPMNPMNLYDDIQVMHFKGFNFTHIRGIENTMNSIDGVAKWSIIDKYSAIICIAKFHSLTEVKKNIENTIYNNLNVKKFSELEASVIEAQGESSEIEEDNIILVFPNGTKKIILSPSEQDVIDVDNLLLNIKNCIAIKNGELYEGR